ncbi:MAG: glycerophosphodiester phosphodiesterase [Clostridiales Family XIII bacterium]|jgi:glycerophosphoryl diester phosphodiesterase|nr:glycerophosphodiester phosphodiesterase [Clostridiales Family XIII bacterium]
MHCKSWILANPIAHRGLHDREMPENSIPAFEAAIEKGISIELDVQLTRDRELVVFHDDNLQRMTGLNKNIWKLSFAELERLCLKHTNLRIPTFREVLDLIGGRVPLLVEIKKHRGKPEPQVVEMLHGYPGEYAIQAFNPVVLQHVRKLDPSIYCGLLSSKFEHEKIMRIKKAGIRNARLFFMAKPDFLSFEINSFPNRRIAGFRKELGLPVLGWTIKTGEDIDKALKFCDNIIFENLTALEESVASSIRSIGEWFQAERRETGETEQAAL